MAFTRLQNTTLGAKEEATPYTYEAPSATDGILLRADMEVNLDREFLEDDTLNGSLTKVASEPGMWSDDLGGMIPVYARAGGSGGSEPEFAVLLKSIMGEQADNTDNTVDNSLADAKTSAFKLTTNPADLEAGQLIVVDRDGNGAYELTRVISYANPLLTVWPPLTAIPVDTAAVYAGTNFMLSDTTWNPYSILCQFDDTKYIKYAGVKTTQMEATFEVGQRVPLNFSFMASTPEYGHDTAVDFASNLDSTTRFLTCLGVELSALFAGVTTGTPTTTQAILATPSFGVASGDKILIDAGTLGSPVTCTFTNGTDIVNKVAHGLLNGARVKFFNSGGALPTGLSGSKIYYVVNKNNDDFQVSETSGGTPALFTDDGTGTNTYKVWTKGTGNWETLAISNVSGHAGENTTLTHATVTNRPDPGDTVYIKRLNCAGVGDTLTITVEMEAEPVKCMAATYGKAGIEFMGRTVTIAKTPYWQDWQDFLLRDNAVTSSLTVFMGDEVGNMMAWYMPALQNTEVSITTDGLMRNDVTSLAVKDTRIGNTGELVIACF